jgi:hypothetical protein
LMETAVCDKHFTSEQQENLRMMRKSWVDLLDQRYDAKSGEARPSERCLIPGASDTDEDLAEMVAGLVSVESIPAVKSCLPWRTWLYHTVLHEPMIPLLNVMGFTGVAGMGALRAGKRQYEQRRAARDVERQAKGGHPN